ncbi:hypothetical protein Tco_0001583 [Tanacetum coccineum]
MCTRVNYSLEVEYSSWFYDINASGISLRIIDPIVATSSPTLTPFGDSDFLLLEEVDSFLGLADDPDCPAYNPFYYDPEGDILLLEAILNSEPPPPLPNHKQYMPGGRKELKLCEAKTIEPSVHEPPEVELKELPPHLEYAFLEGDNKLPVIIAKELDVEEKSALVKVLKSHKRALAWKLSDIQGINPEFCTHKILMEEDYAPAVQHQRRSLGLGLHCATRRRNNVGDVCTAMKLLRDSLSLATNGPTVGHHGATPKPKKILTQVFFWPHHLIKMPTSLSRSDSCQRQGKTSQRDESSKTPSQFVKNFVIWGASTLWARSRLMRELVFLVAVIFVSKWVEGESAPHHDARVVCKFDNLLLAALLVLPVQSYCDRGTHFCNDSLHKVMRNMELLTVSHVITTKNLGKWSIKSWLKRNP